MASKKRAVFAIILVEVMLAGIWLYLARMGQAQPDRVTPDFQQTLGSTMGTAMGAFLGLGIVILLATARRGHS